MPSTFAFDIVHDSIRQRFAGSLMFRTSSECSYICLRCISRTVNSTSLPSQRAPRHYSKKYLKLHRSYSASAATNAENIPIKSGSKRHAEPSTPDRLSSIRRGRQFRAALRKKRAPAKAPSKAPTADPERDPVAEAESTPTQSPQRSTRFSYLKGLDSIPLGLKALGKPVEAVIVREKPRPPDEEEQSPKESEIREWNQDTEKFLRELNEEGLSLEPEKVCEAIDRFKAPFEGRGKDLERIQILEIRRQLVKSFSREQLRLYVEVSRNNLRRNPDAPAESSQQDVGKPVTTFDIISGSITNSFMIAKFIVRHIWGLRFVPAPSPSAGLLKLSHQHSMVFANMSKAQISGLEKLYDVKINLQSSKEKRGLLLHHSGHTDPARTKSELDSVSLKLSKLCEDIAVKEFHLDKIPILPQNARSQVFTNEFLDQVSKHSGVYIKSLPVEKRLGRYEIYYHPAATHEMAAIRDLGVGFIRTLLRTSVIPLPDEILSLSTLLPMPMPENAKSQQLLKGEWARIVVRSPLAKAKVESQMLENISNFISKELALQRQEEPYGLAIGTSTKLGASFGHFCFPHHLHEGETPGNKIAKNGTRKRSHNTFSTDIPLLPHTLSGLTPSEPLPAPEELSETKNRHKSSRGPDSMFPEGSFHRVMLVPPIEKYHLLPCFEVLLYGNILLPTDLRLVSMSAVFSQRLLEVPLPSCGVDIRFTGERRLLLTPPQGISAEEWRQLSQEQKDSTGIAPLDSVIGHLFTRYEDKQYFASPGYRNKFPPTLQMSLPKEWLCLRDMKLSETYLKTGIIPSISRKKKKKHSPAGKAAESTNQTAGKGTGLHRKTDDKIITETYLVTAVENLDIRSFRYKTSQVDFKNVRGGQYTGERNELAMHLDDGHFDSFKESKKRSEEQNPGIHIGRLENFCNDAVKLAQVLGRDNISKINP